MDVKLLRFLLQVVYFGSMSDLFKPNQAMIRSTPANLFIVALVTLNTSFLQGQFYFGNDLSYVNEMLDCGVTYIDNSEEANPFGIFASHGCNLVRLRLWHTPSWHDNLNSGNRYSDLADVKRSMTMAKQHGMPVLLNFHLSDNWADPSKQVVPAAWAPVVDDLPVLKDSLYNYIYGTLESLAAEGLTPEMVQIGNETNKGILQSQEDNDSGWKLDWNRNSQLFNRAIEAVRDFEVAHDKTIKIMIHAAGPSNATWLFEQFIENGVTDFDIMGISYYWAWHKPTTIEDCGNIIASLMSDHPGYEVIIAETGYIWTYEANDDANNIINEVHPDYSPPTPEAQKNWMVDLTQEVINKGGQGVIYWEPAWVSSGCWTQWGRGSHQENAAFFDFDNAVLEDGGMAWMTEEYDNLVAVNKIYPELTEIKVYADSNSRQITIEYGPLPGSGRAEVHLISASGSLADKSIIENPLAEGSRHTMRADVAVSGVHVVVLLREGRILAARKVYLH